MLRAFRKKNFNKDSAKARNYEFDYVSDDFVIREVETEASGYVDDEIALPPETQE
jgi:hypothetical protein